MTVARGAALGALAVAAIVVAIVLLGGNGGHEYKLVFETAGQLVKGDDVQVGGRRVGNVDDIELTNNNQAEIKVTVEDGFAPLHKGTTAVIRLTSLSGVANRYIALSPGPNNAPKIADGATIGTDRTTSVVDLDQLFDTLDKPTRTGLSRFIRGSAQWYTGKERQANLSALYFNPAISTSSAVFDQLTRSQSTLTSAVVDSSRVVTALSQRSGDITDLVGNANQTAAAIASENTSFSQALALLPITLRRANTTFVNLRATLADLTTLVNVSKPATKNLASFFAALTPVVTEAVPAITDLGEIVHLPGPSNDLTDTFRIAPQLASDTSTAASTGITALKKSQPVITFARPYAPDLVGWFRDFGQGASWYDVNGHQAPVFPVFNAYKYNPSPTGGTLTVLPPAERLSTYQSIPHGTGNYERCPGAATQAAPDGSSPFTEGGTLECDPSQVPPNSP